MIDLHNEKRAERFDHEDLAVFVGLEESSLTFLNVVQLVTDVKNIVIVDSPVDDLNDFVSNCTWVLPQIVRALNINEKYLVFIVRKIADGPEDDRYLLINCDWDNQEDLLLGDEVFDPKHNLKAVPVEKSAINFDFSEQLSKMGYPLSKYLGMEVTLRCSAGEYRKGVVHGYDGSRYRFMNSTVPIHGVVEIQKQYKNLGESNMFNGANVRGVNKGIIMGRLGAAPEVYPEKANPERTVVRFVLATTEKWKDKNEKGDLVDKERTDWHRVVVFYPLSNIAAKYLESGKRVYVEGPMVTTKYLDPDGSEKYSTEIQASDIQFAD